MHFFFVCLIFEISFYCDCSECVNWCCNGVAETNQTEPCHDCQCEIKEKDIIDALGFRPADNVLGVLNGTNIIVYFGNDTYYLETHAAVIGYCYYWLVDISWPLF